MTKRTYDSELAAMVPALPTTMDLSTVEKVQAMRTASRLPLPDAPPDRADVTKQDRRVPGPKGAPEVPIRIYRPREEATGPRPGLFEIHGGGFLFGDIEMMDAWCQLVAAEVGAVVVSVEYRLAPEHPFPAGVEDCYAALAWLAAHVAELGVDPARIALAGQSAGGGLAAATALLARDRGGPALCFQLLEIPELDDRLDTPSMRAFTDTPLWNRPNAEWSWRHYLGPDAHGRGRRRTPRPRARRISPGCRPRTSRPWSSTRCATRASSTPCACCRRACRSSCTRTRAPSTARR